MGHQPALALIEFSSVAIGTRASDALIKKAPVTVVRAGSFQPGRYAILFSGDVAGVEEAFVEGLRAGGEAVQDRVLLPDVHPRVLEAVLGRRGDWSHDTLGVIETSTLAATLDASDAAVKGAEVEMVEIRLGDGLGGKGLAHFGGLQADVEAALEIGSARIAYREHDVRIAIIPRVDDDLRSALSKSTRFSEDA